MPTLLLSIGVYLEDFTETLDSDWDVRGPIFHLWIPDGEADALVIRPNKNTEIKLWFERRGYTGTDGFIWYDHKRREVDPSIMERQKILNAGPLSGRLIIKEISESDLKPIIENKQNDKTYIALAKKIIGLLYAEIERLISILRVCYGLHFPRRSYSHAANWSNRSASSWNLCLLGRPHKPAWIS